MLKTSSSNALSDGTRVPIDTTHLTLPSSTGLFAPVHKLLAEPADRDRVEEGGRCRGGSAGLPYRHAVEQVVAAARSLIAREADGLARLLAQSKMPIAGEGFSPQHDRKQKSSRLLIRKLVKKVF